MDDFLDNSRQQMTKQFLELAQTFARKSRRSSTQLTCTDLLNAFACMNILYQQRTVRDNDNFFHIEYQ